MIKQENSFTYCFLLFSFFLIIPFLDFISYNLITKIEYNELQINFLTIKRLSIIYFFFILIFFLILSIFKYLKKNLFYTSLYFTSIYVLIFNYSYLKKIITEVFLVNYPSLIKIDSYISLIFIFIIIISIKFILKKKKIFFTRFLILFFFISIFFELFNIFFSKELQLMTKKIEFKNEKIIFDGKKRNNIYYFILDAMPNTDDFDKSFDYNSRQFLKELENNNFFEVKNSQGRYGGTNYIIGSILNLKNFDNDLISNNKISNKNLYPSALRKNHQSNLEYNLNQLNYNFKWIGNYHMDCWSYNSNYCVDELSFKKNLIFNYETKNFLDKTPLFPILSKIFNKIGFKIEQKYAYLENDSLGKFLNYLNNNQIKKENYFFFIHDLKTHWPYLSDENCNFKFFEGRENLEGIKNTIICSRNQILQISKTISKKDPNAVVIFQSDHNWELSYSDETKYGKRKNFFNIIRLNYYCRNIISKFNTHIRSINLALKCATESSL
jgi:hypothetical protein